MNDAPYPNLATASNVSVPAVFAEKAMASLMQLHGELMDEKERRVDLYRRLMEKEQSLAELKMYVKVLEEKLGVAPPPVPGPAPENRSAQNVVPLPPRMAGPPKRSPQPRPAPPARPAPNDGWKAW